MARKTRNSPVDRQKISRNSSILRCGKKCEICQPIDDLRNFSVGHGKEILKVFQSVEEKHRKICQLDSEIIVKFVNISK